MDHPEAVAPSLEDEGICAYCWKPADIEVEGILTQLNCSRCPARVTAHPECLTMHKRNRSLSISTMTGFQCPRLLSKDPETWCNGKINSTHRMVRRKAPKALPPPMPKKMPQPKPAPNPNKVANSVIVKQPKPKPETPRPVAPAPKPGSSVAARMGVCAAPVSGIIGDEPAEKPAPKPKAQPKVAPSQERRSFSPTGDDPDDIFGLHGSRSSDRSVSPARVGRYIMPQPFNESPYSPAPPAAAAAATPVQQRGSASGLYESFYDMPDPAYDAATAAAIAASLAPPAPAITPTSFPPLPSVAPPTYEYVLPQPVPVHQPVPAAPPPPPEPQQLQQQFPAPIFFQPVFLPTAPPAAPAAKQPAADAFPLPQPIAVYTPEVYQETHPCIEPEEEDDLVGELLALCGVSA